MTPDHPQSSLRARKERLAAAIYEKRLREERKLQSDVGEPGRLGGLIRFIRYFWHVLEPAREFVEGWPVEALCLHLEAITRGEVTGEREITRFLANVPPGFMKSLCLNVFWPAFEWGPMGLPHLRYIAFSYAAHLTERDNAKFRDLIVSPVYQELWGHVFKVTSDGKIKVGNDHQGFKFASSIGGVGTGERADRVLCLPATERILTDRGWLPIGDIVNGRLAVKIAGFDHGNASLVWQGIEAYESNPGNEIVEIACKGGAVRCTGDHPVFVSGHGYARADSLGPGCHILQAAGGFSLPALSERDTASSERAKEILQQRLPLRGGAAILAPDSQQAVQHMWNPSVPAPGAPEAREAGCVLQPRVLSCFQQGWQQSSVYGFARSCLRALRKRLSEVERSRVAEILFSTVLRGRSQGAHLNQMGGASCMSTMQLSLYCGHKDTAVLREEMCGYSSRSAYEGRRKWSLYSWTSGATLSPWLDAQSQGVYSRKGWQSLLSVWRQARAWARAGRSPYRLHKRKSESQEPHNALPLVSWPYARQPKAATTVDVVPVISVARVGQAEATYNLRVGPCHNYFAEGILLHNCDDPHHVHQAESPVIREGTVRWFRESMSNRLNSMKESVIVVIMQRVHEEDVSGAILEDGGYCHLMIPFDYESSRHCTTSIGWTDPREVDGETPWDERFGPDEMAPFRRQIYLWAGQYQQQPAPRGGGILKDEWWQTYVVPDSGVYDFHPLFVVASLDTAFKEKQENDYHALTVWAVFDDRKTKQRRIILVDAWKKRLPLHGVTLERTDGEDERSYMRRSMPKWGLVEWVNFTCSRRRVNRLLIEDSARGNDVNNEIRRLHASRDWGVRLVPVRGDKQSRVHAIVDLFTDEMIYAPGQWVCSKHEKAACKDSDCQDKEQYVWRWRDWAATTIADCSIFPKGAHDDIVDATSMALRHLRENGFAVRRDEAKWEDEERMRHKPQRQPIYPV